MNLFITVIGAVAVLLLGGLLIGLGKDAMGAFKKKDTSDSGVDAIQILDARLARGEISIEEYNALRNQIGR